MLRGKELDQVIENELQLMLVEGYDKSPISNKSVHDRLVAKKHISGGLSTLSNLKRKSLISRYIAEQISPLNLKTKDQQLFVNRKTRQALSNSNKDLQYQVETLEKQLNKNTELLIRIVEEVKVKSNVEIEHILARYLFKR